MNNKRHFLQKPFTLVVALMFFSVFIFSTISAQSKSTFLNAVKFEFTKTPHVLTFGEQLLDFVMIAAPLFLAFAFAVMFFISKKFPVISSNILLLATLIALSGITVFVCLSAYNIIETFNALSDSKLIEGNEVAQNTFTETLITLIPYHFLLIVYAGSFTSFALGIKKQLLKANDRSIGALVFSISNLLLAIWHLIITINPPAIVTNYFAEPSTNKNQFIFCEISIILCFATVAIFTLLYHKNRRSNTQDAA